MSKQQNPIPPRGLTLRQAAAHWGVSYNTFRKLVREGLAPAPVDLGVGRWIFDREQLEEAFNARLRKGAA